MFENSLLMCQGFKPGVLKATNPDCKKDIYIKFFLLLFLGREVSIIQQNSWEMLSEDEQMRLELSRMQRQADETTNEVKASR